MLAFGSRYDSIPAHVVNNNLAPLKREDTHITFLEPTRLATIFQSIHTARSKVISQGVAFPKPHKASFFLARRSSNFFISGDMHWVAGFRASSTHHFPVVNMGTHFIFLLLSSDHDDTRTRGI